MSKGMKKLTIKVKKDKVPSIIKETEESRKERLKYASCMTTRVVPNKKIKSRSQRKDEARKEINNYD